MSDFATLGMDVDSRGLTKGQRELRNLEKQAGRTEKGVGKASALMSRGLVAVGVAAATLFSGGALVRGISQFEESMSRVGAVSRASGKDLQAMRDIALEMGSTTEFSASQAADGLNFLAMAGFDAQESIAALPQVLDLATASGLGLAQSADIASNVISGFGLAATDAAEVADTLAAASSRANTDVGQLGQAMSTVAPIAASLDISVQDTAAAIGVLSDAGIQGARAGTAMRGVLASLAGPTDQARQAIESYGLAVEDVNPETNSLAEIMGRLEKAGLTTADAMTIFGREAASGALALVDANQRVGELTGQLEGAEGAAGDMADAMRDNLGGDIKGLMSAIEGLILALGDAGLTAVLRGVVNTITRAVRGISALTDAFSSLFKGQDDLAKAVDGARNAMFSEAQIAFDLSENLVGLRDMSRDVAGAKIALAEAALQSAEAQRQEAIEAEKATDRFQEQVDKAEHARSVLETYNDLIRAGVSLNEEQAGDIERFAANLRNAVAEQERLLEAAGKVTPEYEKAKAQVDFLKAVLEDATGETVTFENNVREGSEAAGGLRGQVSGVANEMSRAAQNAISFVSNLGQANLSGLRAEVSALEAGASAREALEAKIRGSDEFQMAMTGPAGLAQQAVDGLNAELEAFDLRARKAKATASEFSGSLGGGAGAAKDLEEGLEKTGNEADTLAKKLNSQVMSAVDGVADAFGDFVARGFRDFKGFARSVIDTFRQMLSQMISMAVKNRIMIGLGFSGSGIGGVANAATGGGGLLSGIMGGGAGGGGLLGGALSGVGSAISGITSGVAGIFSGGGLGASFANLGGLMSGAVSGWGAVGAAIPALGLVGAAISLFVPKIKELDKGIRVTADGLETSIEQFRKIEKSRLFGLIKSRSTNYRAARDAVADPILDAVSEMQDGVLEAARVMGTGAAAFQDFSYQFQLSLKGMTEEEKLEAVNKELAKMGDEFASLVPGFEDMNSLLASANAALQETFGLGRTRFEAEMLVAARRRGEITTVSPGPGGSTSEDLIRLQSLDNTMKASDEKAEENNRILAKLLRIWEGFEIDGVPRGPVVE